MSVPVHKRSESKLDFFVNAYKVYDTIVYYLLKDFGVKGVCKDLNVFTYGAKMTEEDASTFKDLCTSYNIGVETKYPYWLLEQFRDVCMNTLNDLLLSITMANSIYPNSEYEFNVKRNYQWKAISDCEYLLQIFQRIISILPINIEKYTKIIELICIEIDTLRKWKKSSNKKYKEITNKNMLNLIENNST